jgi:hypothetical protein
VTTNSTVINDALRLLGVIGEAETANGEQGVKALRALNQMLVRWDEDGIKLGYFEQSSTTDTCPIPAWAEQGVTSKLAQRLMADYPASVPPGWVLSDGENGFGTLLRKSVHESLKSSDMSHLPAGAAGRINSDITNGWF